MSFNPYSGSVIPLFDHFVSVGNVNTSETDLYSDDIAANTLVDNGDKLEFMYAGILDGALVNKSISIYFGGDLLFALPNQTLENMEWQISGTIIKSSPSEYKYTIEYHSNDSSGLSGTSAGTTSSGSGINFAEENILKLTGISAGSSDEVVAKLGFVKFVSHA